MPRAAVLGSPIAHSLSPILHNAGYAAVGLKEWSYTRFEVTADTLVPFLEECGPEYRGFSVTMPGKFAALEVAEERELARADRVVGDRAVGLRPVDREAERAPQVLELLLVDLRELLAQLDAASPTGGAVPGTPGLLLTGLKLVDGMGAGQAVFHQPRVTIEHVVAEDIEAERHRVYAAFDKMREQIDRIVELALAEIDRIAEDRTALVIAHRLSTVRNAQRIVVLTENGIAEQGTHDQLMQGNGVYAQLQAVGARL